MENDIKNEVLKMYNDVSCANYYVNDIIKALESCREDTNLTVRIGMYAQHIPDFNFLTNLRNYYLSLIRQVCTGEISYTAALELFRENSNHLHEASNCFNS